MNKLILTLFFVGIVFISSCSQSSKILENVQPRQDYCTSDGECVLKPSPFCCASDLEYIDICYFINDEPESISCEGNTVCPGFQRVIDCKCENRKCVDIFE